jgi:hypothetical protein
MMRHGFGTLGPNGEGAGVEQGIQDEIDIYFATFAIKYGEHWCIHSKRKICRGLYPL